jgi:hypothetical protein
MKRGQNSLELVVLLGFAMLIFISFFVVIQEQIRMQGEVRQQELLIQVADLVETEFLTAAKVNDGFMRRFDLPLTLDGQPYNISLEDTNTLVVEGAYTSNEYLRFLGVNVTVINSQADNVIVPRPVDPAYALLIQKNASGLFIRNDCAVVGGCI